MNLRFHTFLLMLVLVGAGFLSSCASFSGSVLSETPQGAEDNSRLDLPRKIRFRFTGWTRSQDTSALQKKLEAYGLTTDETAKDLLLVYTEQEESTEGGWRLLNLLVTAWSRLIVPFYNQVNRRIEYRLYRENQLSCTFIAHTRNNEFVGILMLPLSPFFWPAGKQTNLWEESADLFAKTCLDTLPIAPDPKK